MSPRQAAAAAWAERGRLAWLEMRLERQAARLAALDRQLARLSVDLRRLEPRLLQLAAVDRDTLALLKDAKLKNTSADQTAAPSESSV